MENKKQKLESLKKRNIELAPIIFKGFDNDNELDRHIEKNKFFF